MRAYELLTRKTPYRGKPIDLPPWHPCTYIRIGAGSYSRACFPYKPLLPRLAGSLTVSLQEAEMGYDPLCPPLQSG